MTRRVGPRQTADGADGMVILGLLLVGLAVGLAWGWAALLAYAGVVLVLAGGALAAVRGRK